MDSAGNQQFNDALGQLPGSLRPLAERAWQRIVESIAATGDAVPVDLPWPASDCSTFAKMLACSDYAAGSVNKYWPWFQVAMAEGRLNSVPVVEAPVIDEEASEAEVKRALRTCRHQAMLHILWREYSGQANLAETLSGLSRLADAILLSAQDAAVAAMKPRFGLPRTADGGAIPLVILAMGKLGGSELNLSSDADLIFLYSEDGVSDGPRELSASEYFTRLTRRIVNLVDDVTEDGFAYRIDTRLRPFGDSGPPVISFLSLESYLLQHGRSWERYAYVKARAIGRADAAYIENDLMQNLVNPFVYRRYLDYGIFESLRDMKAMIAAEVSKRELADNVKLGPGGIREIEFIVQSLQLVRGGQNDNLRRRELARAMRELVRTRSLSDDVAQELSAAYEFLRRLENFIQAIRDQQTHDLPDDETDRQRLALAMGFGSCEELQSELDRHREHVSRHFQDIAFRGDSIADAKGQTVQAALDTASREAWESTLTGLGFTADRLPDVLARFSSLTAVRQMDSTSRRRLVQFIPAALQEIQRFDNTADALERMLAIAEKVLRRSAYVALLNENPAVMRRVASLCATSAYFAAEIARYPLLLDELLDPGLFGDMQSQEDMRQDAEERLRQVEADDSERKIELLAQFQRATRFRIAIAEMTGSLPIMKVSDALSDLAEVVLSAALAIAWQDLASQYGVPTFIENGRTRLSGFGVVAYGKLGGMELSYGSDLDLVFLHNSAGEIQVTNGEKSLDNGMFFQRLVRRLVHFLTAQTPSGALYEVDMRLRPSGRAGLLVSSLEAFQRYQDENAWTWEHQALLRSRPVAGSVDIGREFERIRTTTLRRRVERATLAQEVTKMRARMRENLDRSNEMQFDLKQGAGGIGDLEFIVQFLALHNAEMHPAVIFYPDNIRQLGSLGAAGVLEEFTVSRLQEIYREYRTRAHRLALDSQPPLVDAGEFEEARRFVSEMWAQILE